MKFINIFLSELKQFQNFKSRTNKEFFWTFTLVNILFSIVLSLLSTRLSSLYSLIVFIPSIAIGVRRLHDIGKSGINMLWLLLPIIGWIYLLMLFLQKGDLGENQWGKDS